MLRELCPALANKTYFNYGGQGPLPTPSLDAITTSWKRIQELGPFTTDIWPYISAEVSKTRGRLARLCNVPAHRLALSENVTTGCVLPLWGLPLHDGDHILISDCEHPGVVAACHELARRRQLQVHTLPVKQLRLGRDQQARTDHDVLAAIEQQLTSRTRLVVLSHLLWNTGQQMPITAVAAQLQQHPAQPYLLVDAAQSVGQIPIAKAAQAADIYAFTGHKWVCGPEGLGGVAISERMLTEAHPTVIGWRSLQDETRAVADDPDPFHHDSRRFEVATSCVPLMAGLRCSLDLLEQEGSDDERLRHIRTLSEQLWKELQSLPEVSPLLEGPPPAGLVSFQMHSEATGATPSEVVKALGAEQIWIRDLADPICLRACTHVCTSENDIAQLIDQIRMLSAMNS
ncbi:pyridoxal phosphate-dependent monomeric L-cysteine/cystine C-S-lyase [Synechococcus sp. BIOS-U3-1]|uniref:aminotransferase class V-fold PLP-dependent enzyme n=1 Tax=Synechococcus sp. BIOS-U3-1 TaxID=1400865 RepID=UPI001646E6BC|nr:aminotransferase class V-fold PLP-dependent enzyme [Synechococcus sp. BIOS-U3-1]QNI57596.1 pyridoxal phosphate-dependent monomeric L-cysteine/cystine C-S-lyase [Synechococcus sp. BIOS-U3-1]|tara:strand:+ start:279 stop:1481 length:1203 start_codon:yes stop_codon:yes gene_type:complete